MNRHFAKLLAEYDARRLMKAAEVDKSERDEAEKDKPSGPPKDGPQRRPKTLKELLEGFGDDGASMNDIVRVYADAAGLKTRRVNRTTLLHSLDRMVDSGLIATKRDEDGDIRYYVLKREKRDSEPPKDEGEDE